MLQVPYIIAHEVFESGRLGRADWLPRENVQVVFCARTRDGSRLGCFHHVRNVMIEGLPEEDEVGPLALLIVLNGDPVILLVTGEHQVILQLRADETSVVVRRRVDQVADDLLRRPPVRRRSDCGLGARQRSQARG